MAETAKLASVGILFIISCVSGLILPYIVLKILTSRCNNMARFNTVLSALNCFSGGVFIATAMIILLPEAVEITEEALMLMNADIHLPITELLVGFGFLLILLIDSIVDTCHQRHSRNAIAKAPPPYTNGGTANGTPSLTNGENAKVTSSFINGTTAKSTSTNSYGMSDRGTPPLSNGALSETVSYQNSHVVVYTIEDANKSENEDGDGDDHDHAVVIEGMGVVQSIALLIALSIHMIFDGTSLGLVEEDDDVWKLLLALLIHKALIFFSMGIHISESTTFCKFAAAMLYLSAVSPVGVGIGILLSSHSDSIRVTTASAVLQSIATGTFIYVALFEILRKELSNTNSKLMKSCFVILGYVFLSVIKFAVH